jgi:hypothetical protein
MASAAAGDGENILAAGDEFFSIGLAVRPGRGRDEK